MFLRNTLGFHAYFARFCQLDKITESLDSEKQQHKQAFLYNHELPTLVRNASSILIRFRARRRDKSAPAVAVDVSRLEEQFYVTPHFRYILSSIIYRVISPPASLAFKFRPSFISSVFR